MLVAWASFGLGGSAAPHGSATASSQGAQPPHATLTASSLVSCLARERNGVEGTPQRALLAILGVLRRPATPADTLPRDTLLGSAAYLRYIRRARIVDGVSYYIYPVVALGCGQTGAYDALALLGVPRGTAVGAGCMDVTVTQVERGGAVCAGTPFVTTPRRSSGPTLMMVVPDGVASVTLHYAARPSLYFRGVTVVTRPVNNLIVFGPPHARISPFPTLIKWLAPDGHVLKTIQRP